MFRDQAPKSFKKNGIRMVWYGVFISFLLSQSDCTDVADLGLQENTDGIKGENVFEKHQSSILRAIDKCGRNDATTSAIFCGSINKLHYNLTNLFDKLQDTLFNLISNNCHHTDELTSINDNYRLSNPSSQSHRKINLMKNIRKKQSLHPFVLLPLTNEAKRVLRKVPRLIREGGDRRRRERLGPPGFLNIFRHPLKKCLGKVFYLFLRQFFETSTTEKDLDVFLFHNNRVGKQSRRLMIASALKKIVGRDIANMLLMMHRAAMRLKKSHRVSKKMEKVMETFRLEIDGNNSYNETVTEEMPKRYEINELRRNEKNFVENKYLREFARMPQKNYEGSIENNKVNLDFTKLSMHQLISKLPSIPHRNYKLLNALTKSKNKILTNPKVKTLYQNKHLSSEGDPDNNFLLKLKYQSEQKGWDDTSSVNGSQIEELKRVHKSGKSESLLGGNRLKHAKVKRSVSKRENSKSSRMRKEKSTILLYGEWSQDFSSGWLNDDWEEVENPPKDYESEIYKNGGNWNDEKASERNKIKWPEDNWSENESSKYKDTDDERAPPFSEVHYISWKRNKTTFPERNKERGDGGEAGDNNYGPPTSCLCWNTTDYGGKLEVECKCSRWNSNLSPPELDHAVQRITISDPHLKVLLNNSFQSYSKTLQDIVIMEASSLNKIEAGIFQGLTNLQSFSIFNALLLENLSNLNLNNALPKLRSMRILSSGLSKSPQMKVDDNHGIFSMIDFENNQIKKLETRSFRIKADQLVLNYNKITVIEEEAFYDSKIGKLSLKGNRMLENIHPNAFSGVRSLRAIDLSGTSITSLPTEGLEGIEELWLEDVPTLKVFPSVYSFKSISVAHLTYPYHCCAFQFPQQHNPQQHEQYMAKIHEQEQELCSELPSVTPVSRPTSAPGYDNTLEKDPVKNTDNAIHLSKRNRKPLLNSSPKHRFHKINNRENIHSSSMPNLDDLPSNGFKRASPADPTLGTHFFHEEGVFLNSFGTLNDSRHFLESWQEENLYESGPAQNEKNVGYDDDGSYDWSPLDEIPPYRNSQEPIRGKGTSHGTFHKTAANVQNETLFAFCGKLSKNYRDVTCYPSPDAFNPCEDIMGRLILRIGVWLVVILAVVGNLAVMLVLVSSRFKMTVSKFLMVNLAAADLCMGLYLLMIGAMDLHTMGHYFNYAIDWQNGIGCQLAGFLTVFASELSIFTLTLITSERWYAITYAINLNKRLKLSVARKFMCLGWIYSIAMGALPILGVSGYSKTSICLPMDIRNGVSLAYLISLLMLNGLAFLVISACYVSMYCSISSHDAMATHSDLKVAKRMALLVFTDFACWAPIAFFGLTAVAGAPLINVSNSKILLVTFYPLNSCANPYLYAILTRQYRRDLFTLLERYGFCTQRAVRCTLTSPRSLDFRYKGAYSSVNNTHPNNMLANNSSVPQHRNSTQTQITLCDLSRLARASMQSQQGVTLTQGGLIISQDSIPISVSPLRTPTKQESQCCEVEKLTTVKETSHSSESSVQVDNFIIETINDEISVAANNAHEVVSTSPSVDHFSKQRRSPSFPSKGLCTEDEDALIVVPKPKILILKRKVPNLNLNSEPEVDINAEGKIRFSKRSSRPKVLREYGDFDHYLPNENDNCDGDDLEDDDYDESRIIVEAGSPHPLKSCYTSLVVSPEQQEILEKALQKSKKNRKKQVTLTIS